MGPILHHRVLSGSTLVGGRLPNNSLSARDVTLTTAGQHFRDSTLSPTPKFNFPDALAPKTGLPQN